MDIAYLDGTFLPLRDARVPVLDRGYLFADGAYEVLPSYGGKLFALDAHLERLELSLAALFLPNPLTRAQWREMLDELVRRNGGGDLTVYLQVSRGVQPLRSFALPTNPAPCVLALCQPLPPITEAIRQQGVGAVSHEDTRWLNCHIKSIALLGAVLLSNEALKAGCNEVILFRDGKLTEGGSSNVFIVRDGTVATPPKSRLILAGVTRDILLKALRGAGVACEEREIAETELRGADEVWITSSTREVFPVTRLDDKPVAGGKPGPLWARAFALYQDCKAKH